MNPRDTASVSSCCGADLRVDGTVTQHFVCRACSRPCDAVAKHSKSAKCVHNHDAQLADGYKTCRWCHESLYPANLATEAAGRILTRAMPVAGEIQANRPHCAKKMSKTEAKYRLLLLTEFPDVRFEAVTFKMRNGHRYTPDFLCANADGDILEFHEVKGSYRLHSHSRARLAFDQCRAEYGMFKFVWATQNKKGGFDV